MDHIPRPRNSEPSLEFPYYNPAAWDHDVTDFKFWGDYCVRSQGCQWNISRLGDETLDIFLEGRPFNGFAAFLQSRLYFGMLALCLGQNDFSRLIGINLAGEKVLNTTLLLPLVQQWHDRTFQRHMRSPDPHGSYEHELSHLKMVLSRVKWHTDSLVQFDKHEEGPRGTALFRIGVPTKLVWNALN